MRIWDKYKLLRLMGNGRFLSAWKTLGWLFTGFAFISPDNKGWATKKRAKRKAKREVKLIQRITMLRNSNGQRGMFGTVDNSPEIALMEAELYQKPQLKFDSGEDFPEASPVFDYPDEN